MSDCSFCDLGNFASQIILENESCYLLYPRNPVFKYHLMAATKLHVEDFIGLSEEQLVDLRNMVEVAYTRIESGTGKLGYNLFSNNGDRAIGQRVPHFHMHMFLRFTDEAVSPYEIMNKGMKTKPTTDEWIGNFNEIKRLAEELTAGG